MAAQLGRYEIRKELGRGGMATVYLGYDPQFKREVAVKVLPPQFTHDPSFFSRFEQEAETIAGLEHTAIVPVYDYGREQDNPYFVMRLMAGDLRQAIQQRALPSPQVLAICQRICAALDKAHSRGIIHRDIKPSNILFDDDGFAYLADFGIVRLAELTHTVTMIGTAEYMTPEQIRGEGVDGRSDVYQMGVVIFEMLTGQQPFTGENTAALLYKHAHEPAPALRDLNAALPAACEAVIHQALAKYPADRFATAGALAAALAVALAEPITATPTAVSPPPPIQPAPKAQAQTAAPESAAAPSQPIRPQREAETIRPAERSAEQAAAARPPLLTSANWRGLGAWVLANALGWLIGNLLAQTAATYFDYNGYANILTRVLVVAILGIAWGTGQWLALRTCWPQPYRWVFLTLAAFSIPAFFWMLMNALGIYLFDSYATGYTNALLAGGLVGAAQWLLLRRQTSLAWVWIPACMAAQMLAQAVALYWYGRIGFSSWNNWLVVGEHTLVLHLLLGLVWGLATGAALLWLTAQARQKPAVTA